MIKKIQSLFLSFALIITSFIGLGKVTTIAIADDFPSKPIEVAGTTVKASNAVFSLKPFFIAFLMFFKKSLLFFKSVENFFSLKVFK